MKSMVFFLVMWVVLSIFLSTFVIGPTWNFALISN